MGGSENLGNVNLLTPEQSNYLSSSLSPNGNYSEFLQPYDPQNFQDLFQKSFVEPAQQHLQRDIIPALKEGFLGLDESGSGALNRALAQSATDVSTGLGQQYMNFYNQQQANKLGALGQLGGMAGQHTFMPHINQIQGLLPGILNALAGLGGSYLKGGF